MKNIILQNTKKRILKTQKKLRKPALKSYFEINKV